MKNKHIISAASTLLIGFTAMAQESTGWHLQDPATDSVVGTSVERSYTELLKDKTPKKKVIVAILDSGVEIEHEDLKGNLWVNEDEIPGNGIDDDNNGYIDDIHGWNYLGNANGENIEYDNLEYVRMLNGFIKKFDGVSEKEVAKADKKDYELYLELQKEWKSSMDEANGNLMQMNAVQAMLAGNINKIKEHLNVEKLTMTDVKNMETEDEDLNKAAAFLGLFETEDLDGMMNELDGVMEYFQSIVNHHLNLEENSRAIVGDDPNDYSDSNYGNPDVFGGSGEHGSHVAGIVGATRDNDLGMKGAADYVELMAVRMVPNGDERDKDVANGIRYAVDNGADILNMSFGKMYSPGKAEVENAIRYAEANGVLIIHAAGNDNKNIDKEIHYPYHKYSDGKMAQNWIVVGASDMHSDSLKASFSNYGKKTVDIFAPGVAINSTVPENTYEENNGTSMASPLVAGIAALIWTYYPELSPVELKEVIMSSGTDYKNQKVAVRMNGETKEVKFKKLCASGKVINAYNALLQLESQD